jgi:murein DD-endopeptidase MepM/ murein hydrolase activator NlpD
MKTFTLSLFMVFLNASLSSYSRKENPAVVAKSLIFPVTGSATKIGSVWGDDRDGGKRKHEGIDIFASKGTPVVSVTDGVVTEVSVDDIGGKNVTVQSDNHAWRSYYAHLDAQHVQPGQLVKKGQLIGTVGNTGNAQTTPYHLHFGIYTENGAVDPLPYVKSSPHITAPIDAGPVVFQNKKIERKSRRNKIRFSEEIKTAAAGILSGIFSRKMKEIIK